jgi:hypothetical protein
MTVLADQSQLAYSFEVKDSQFVVIYTDPVGKDNSAPVVWSAMDMADAQARGA